MPINEQTLNEIAGIRKRWADAEQREIQERTDLELNLRQRLRDALLQTEKPFVPGCTCDQFLSAALECREAVCEHFNGSIYWLLNKQGF